MWTSAPVTRWGGASRWSKACSVISAERLAPTPPCGQPSSTITTWLVFATESRIESRSSGRRVRGSITSAETPCSRSKVAAASIATFAILKHAQFDADLRQRRIDHHQLHQQRRAAKHPYVA